ncbi:MAG: hypothetical protein EPO06_11855 [Burkholderiaceae bacterium]|nr:MAG: hypothetical protein EPO06_11855 [Burkholderiaceae bacterium]
MAEITARRRTGRPIVGDEPRDKWIHMRVTSTERRLLDRVVERDGLSDAELIRSVLTPVLAAEAAAEVNEQRPIAA